MHTPGAFAIEIRQIERQRFQSCHRKVAVVTNDRIGRKGGRAADTFVRDDVECFDVNSHDASIHDRARLDLMVVIVHTFVAIAVHSNCDKLRLPRLEILPKFIAIIVIQTTQGMTLRIDSVRLTSCTTTRIRNTLREFLCKSLITLECK